MALSTPRCQLRTATAFLKAKDGSETQMLVSTMTSATSTQIDLTNSLSTASRALPEGCVASNARMPKALAPRGNMPITLSPRHIDAIGPNHPPRRTLSANNSGLRPVSTNSITSIGSHGFTSNHTCAHVAEEVGHGIPN